MKTSRILLTTLKGVAIFVAALAILAVAAIGIAVWILTPERLTPMVQRAASEYLDAEIGVKRVELTFWSTFPKVTLQVDSLVVTSNAFKKLTPEQRDSLPADADQLLRLERLTGGINLPALLNGAIKLYDIELQSPEVRLVQFDSNTANYLIVPPSEADSAASEIPDISINRFSIKGNTPIIYYSLADSIDLTVKLLTTELIGSEAPTYSIDLSGTSTGKVADLLNIEGLPFGLNGYVKWDADIPNALELKDFELSVGDIAMNLNAELDFADSLTVKSADIHGASLHITHLLSLVKNTTGQQLPDVTTDLTMDIHAAFASPYRLGADVLPDIRLDVTVPKGRLEYERLRLNTFAADISAFIEKGDINHSRFDIKELKAIGQGVGFVLEGTVTADGDIANPLVKGLFNGGVGFERLPRLLLAKLPCTLKGYMTGTTDFRFRPSDLQRVDLNAIKLDGNLTLNNFSLDMRDSSATAYTRLARLDFGANSKMKRDSMVIDSLARVSLNVDTLSYAAGGITFAGRGMLIGAGVRHDGKSRYDSTRVLPVGIVLKGERIAMRSDSDSLRIRLRDFEARAALTRFNGNVHRPQLSVDVEARRAMYADRLNRATLTDANLSLMLHPRKHPRLSPAGYAIYDSISRACPNLRLDSVYALTQAELRAQRKLRGPQNDTQALDSAERARRRMANEAARANDLDFGVDNSVKTWLRLWEASGSIKARRARGFTPYFPMRNAVENVDVTFNTDSVVITDTRYRGGSSQATLNGRIANISSALTSRRGAPIEVDVDIEFDTLDINSFAQAVFAGSAFAARADSAQVGITAADVDNDEDLQRAVEEAAPADTLAFVVPANLKAKVRLNANEVQYSDIWFQRVNGNLEIDNGSIHLDRFAGYTNMGTIDLTALYSAPNLRDINFAAGMVIRRLDLKKFLHMLPQIDSLLPLLNHIEGIVTADLGMTTELDSLMDFKFHTLRAAMKLEGDSLVVLDNETFRKASKWLVFKNKDRNMIDHMEVELLVRDSKLDFMPFQFDIDRYKLGVWGGNTLDMKYDYHIAVLKSPLPFKFGINISGHGDKFKIRLGKANFNPDKIVRQQQLTDTVRINLVNEIRNVFHFGVNSGRQGRKLRLSTGPVTTPGEFSVSDDMTHADSVLFMQEGVLEMTPAVADSIRQAQAEQQQGKKKNKKKNRRKK